VRDPDGAPQIPLAVLVECPTIAALAVRLGRSADSSSVVLLHDGGGDAPPVYLVHDADGETLLYRNLAKRIGGRVLYVGKSMFLWRPIAGRPRLLQDFVRFSFENFMKSVPRVATERA